MYYIVEKSIITGSFHVSPSSSLSTIVHTHNHHHHHHHHIPFMESGHLSRSVSHVSRNLFKGLPWCLPPVVELYFITLGNYFGAFYLHVVSSFSCIPGICPKLVFFLTPLQIAHLIFNLYKCILLFFSCISSLLLLFLRSSDIKFVSYSSTITMMHGPIYIRFDR